MEILNRARRLLASESGQMLCVGILISAALALFWFVKIGPWFDYVGRVLWFVAFVTLIASEYFSYRRFAASGRTLYEVISRRPMVAVLTVINLSLLGSWIAADLWPGLPHSTRAGLKSALVSFPLFSSGRLNVARIHYDQRDASVHKAM